MPGAPLPPLGHRVRRRPRPADQARRTRFPPRSSRSCASPSASRPLRWASCAGRSTPTPSSAGGSPMARCPSSSTRSASSGCGTTTDGRTASPTLVAADKEASIAGPRRVRRAQGRAPAGGRRASSGAGAGRARRPAGPPGRGHSPDRRPSAPRRRRRPPRRSRPGPQLAEARLAARHANDRAEAARQKAGRPARPSATQRRSEPPRPSASATHLLADRAERGGAAVSGAQVGELRELAGSARRLADRLGELVDVAPTARVPLSLPGGVARDSRRAAEFLLRATGALVLVDGYNVAKLGWPGEDAVAERAAGASSLPRTSPAASGARSWSCSTAPGWSGRTPTERRTVRVQLLAPPETADDVIRSLGAGGAGRASAGRRHQRPGRCGATSRRSAPTWSRARRSSSSGESLAPYACGRAPPRTRADRRRSPPARARARHRAPRRGTGGRARAGPARSCTIAVAPASTPGWGSPTATRTARPIPTGPCRAPGRSSSRPAPTSPTASPPRPAGLPGARRPLRLGRPLRPAARRSAGDGPPAARRRVTGPSPSPTTTRSSTARSPTSPGSAGSARTPTSSCPAPGAGSSSAASSRRPSCPSPSPVADGCGTCRRCLDACPTGAIVAPGVIDANRCLAWVLQRPGLDPRAAARWRSAIASTAATTARRRARRPCASAGGTACRSTAGAEAWVDVLDLLDADDDTLLERHGRWYIAGRDPRWLRRNALVVLGNTADRPTTRACGATLARYRHARRRGPRRARPLGERRGSACDTPA